MTSAPGRSAARRARIAARDLVAVLWVGAAIWYLVTPDSAQVLGKLPPGAWVAIGLVGLVGARRLMAKLIAYAHVVPRARRNRLDLARHLARRPAIGLADLTYEVAALASSSIDIRYKYLASVRTSSLIGCPF